MKVINRARTWWSKPARLANLREFISQHIPLLLEAQGRRQLLGYLRHGLTLQFDAEILAILHNIAPGSAIVDVGSNVGKFAELFLERGYTVLSIDPLPQAVEKQREKFGHYIADNKLRLYNVACSDEEGLEKLRVSSDANGCYSSLKESWMTDIYHSMWAGETISVQKIRLATIIEQYVAATDNVPAFVKIDTEGYEYEVLRGLFGQLSVDLQPRLLMFEFHTHPSNRQNLENCLALLKKQQYQTFKYFIRHWDLLVFESAWSGSNFNLDLWNERQGMIPAGFRHGNILACRP